jgi:hypothetical protein
VGVRDSVTLPVIALAVLEPITLVMIAVLAPTACRPLGCTPAREQRPSKRSLPP